MPHYRTAILTYLDVLGFSELVQQSASDPTKVSEIMSILNIAKKRGTFGSATGGEYPTKLITHTLTFSDLIIRITYVEPHDDLIVRLNMELMMLAGIQCELTAIHGILLRGGVSLGPCYADDEYLFGPALIQSYRLEEQVALFPRIVIDTELVTEAAKRPNEIWPKVIRRGEDASYFIDYLYAGWQNPSGGFIRTGFRNADAMMSAHRFIIEDKLNHVRGDRARQKLLWTALYHNSVIDRLTLDGGNVPASLKISDQLLR
jgi:hypothetical protein